MARLTSLAILASTAVLATRGIAQDAETLPAKPEAGEELPPANPDCCGPRPITLATQIRITDRLPVRFDASGLDASEIHFQFYGPSGERYDSPTPALVAFRAGSIYRFAVANATTGNVFHGTVEALVPMPYPAGAKVEEFPIRLSFDGQDLDTLRAGGMVTKIVALEDPETALPVDGSDPPIRYFANAGENPLRKAQDLGEPLLIVRVGSRVPSEHEIVHVSRGLQPGMLLLGHYVRIQNTAGEVRETVGAFHDVCTKQRITLPQGPIVQASWGGSFLDKLGSFCGPTRCGQPAHSGCASCAPGGRGPMPAPVVPAPGCAPIVSPRLCPTPPAPAPRVVSPVPNDFGARGNPFVCDGGDLRPKTGFGRYGILLGVGPTDAVAEYVDNLGNPQIVESNRLCIFAPRFIEVRGETHALGIEDLRGSESVARTEAPDMRVGERRDAMSLLVVDARAVEMRERASLLLSEQYDGAFLEVLRLGVTEQIAAPEVLIGEMFPIEVSGVQQALVVDGLYVIETLMLEQYPVVMAQVDGVAVAAEVTGPKEIREITIIPKEPGKICLEKFVSTKTAQIGDEVTFVLRYTNTGEEPVENVAVVDSLSPRLEYVPRSAESTRPAVFTAEPNEAGSQLLRWEIEGAVGPGESGMVRFKAKLR